MGSDSRSHNHTSCNVRVVWQEVWLCVLQFQLRCAFNCTWRPQNAYCTRLLSLNSCIEWCLILLFYCLSYTIAPSKACFCNVIHWIELTGLYLVPCFLTSRNNSAYCGVSDKLAQDSSLEDWINLSMKANTFKYNAS